MASSQPPTSAEPPTTDPGETTDTTAVDNVAVKPMSQIDFNAKDPKPVSPDYFVKPKDYGEINERVNAIEKRVASLKPNDLSLINGPFHYQIRAGTYGDIYDEIPWRVMVGLQNYKPRDPNDRSLKLRSYCNGVLLNNVIEERRDRQYIRNHRTPISQYGHLYKTTYGEAFGKVRVCNKERAHLQTMKSYPISVTPAYQPELNVDMLRCCVPKPEECIYADAKEKYYSDMAKQKRFDAVNEQPKEFKYNTQDMAKCLNNY